MQSVVTCCPDVHGCFCLGLEPLYPRQMALEKGRCDKRRVIPGSNLEVERALDMESEAWV